MQPNCPLCEKKDTNIHYEDLNRAYWHCGYCALIFVPSQYHLNPFEEKAIYDQHENNPDDSGYRAFLNKLVSPMNRHLKSHHFPANAKGLDFGSGPGPTLSLMFSELGYEMNIFDIYYANKPEVLKRSYDFISSTEVWEHLSKPKEIINDLFCLTKERFILGIMTKRIPQTSFERWHYIKDPTHITFFADQTLEYIASKYDCELQLPESDTAIFIKT